MDQRLPYEEIISGKLQSLPIPDLADAIWARVERQLDLELPTNDGGGSPAPGAGPGVGPIGWGLSVALVALISIFYFSKGEQKNTGSNPVIAAPQIQLQPKGSLPQKEENNTSNSSGTRKASAQTGGTGPPLIQTADSSAGGTIGSVVPDVIDSAVARPQELVAVPPAQDSAKKKRGVSGLTDGDYRIVPKKDNR